MENEKHLYYSRRFKTGDSRFSTRVFIEDGFVVLTQSERMDNPRIDNRNSVILSLQDFHNMIAKLGLK